MKDRIIKTIEKTFNITNVDNSVSQTNCEKWDSLNHLNLIIELESEFDVSFEPEEIAEMKDFLAIESVLKFKMK